MRQYELFDDLHMDISAKANMDIVAIDTLFWSKTHGNVHHLCFKWSHFVEEASRKKSSF
jgi:hypothetical protein